MTLVVADAWDWAREFWLWFPRSAGWMLVMVGFLAITWFGSDAKRRGGVVRRSKEEYTGGLDPSTLLRALSYVGLVLGLLITVAAVVGLVQDVPPSAAYARETLGCDFYAETCRGNNNFTSLVLVVLGLVCFLKPVSDVPWAALVGLLAGTAAAVLLAFVVPVPAAVTGWQYWKYIVAAVFVVVALLVAAAWKLATDLLVGLAKVLAWPPVALVVAAFCFVQGALLLGPGVSLVAW